MTVNHLVGASFSQPDLGWSQLKETILMINLAIAQIDHTMHEGNQSIDTLADSFTVLADIINDINDSLDELPDGAVKDKLVSSSQQASDKVAAAIVAFQFYDKLSQRLNHVSSDLANLSELISDPNSLYSPPRWKELQLSIREKYTMEEERAMFDKVLSGTPIDQAIREFIEETEQNKSRNDDVELF